MIRAILDRLFPGRALKRADAFARSEARKVCTATECTRDVYHAPCHFQTAIANRAAAMRPPNSAMGREAERMRAEGLK